MKSHENGRNLRRAIALPQAAAIVAGIIIGASIFVQPSEITGRVPSVSGIFLVWFVLGLLTFFGAMACTELASMFTRTGGVYLYLKEAFPSPMGFLWGWAMFWTIHSGIIAAVAVISSFAIVGNQILAEPIDAFLGLSLVLSGLPVYYFWIKKTKKVSVSYP